MPPYLPPPLEQKTIFSKRQCSNVEANDFWKTCIHSGRGMVLHECSFISILKRVLGVLLIAGVHTLCSSGLIG
jgi:hypothetical protein